MDRIEKTWFQLTDTVNAEAEKAQNWFYTLKLQQSASERHYHNLKHVKHLLTLIEEHESEIECAEALQFAAFFHDHVYNAGSSNNERLSVEIALKAMTELGVCKKIISRTSQMILATKSHECESETLNHDLLLFLDMDMAILGTSTSEYFRYREAVKKEFRSCPNYLFERGRIGFLQKTLSQPFIYHTETFRNQYELAARRNLSEELIALGPKPPLLDYRAIIHACVKHHSRNESAY